jgi:diaminopimelate epimerase
LGRVAFAKYHGLGNDFVVVDLRSLSVDDAAAIQDPATVRAVCDRQFGIGADGILALLAGQAPGAAVRMRVLNADGSEAEMCGNGIRCVAKHLFDSGLAGPEVYIDTGAGSLQCQVSSVEELTWVRVDMGVPRLARAQIPMVGPDSERCIDVPITLAGDRGPRAVTAVSMGNPHAVIFTDSSTELRGLAESLGSSLEHHPWFPRGANASFAAMRSAHELDLVVWERGCGITLACGTGACATAVAACLTQRAQAGEDITVHLLGGTLSIHVAADYSRVLMSGPAVHVYSGTFSPAELRAGGRP